MILINYYFYLFSVHFSICPFVRLSFVRIVVFGKTNYSI